MFIHACQGDFFEGGGTNTTLRYLIPIATSDITRGHHETFLQQ